MTLDNWLKIVVASEAVKKSQQLDGKSQELLTKKQELDSKSQEFPTKKQELDSKSQEFPTKKQELGADFRPPETRLEELPLEIAGQIEAQGKKGNPAEMLNLVLKILEGRSLSAAELAKYLERTPDYVRRNYLRPLIESGRVRTSNPANPTDPGLTYTATSNRDDPQ
ncbi:MAG: hypothetical protein R3C12_21120 [Planctomycetaceae bacterium]